MKINPQLSSAAYDRHIPQRAHIEKRRRINEIYMRERGREREREGERKGRERGRERKKKKDTNKLQTTKRYKE